MFFRIAGILFVALACAPLAAWQHGTAEPGFYTFNYHGDTWTGTLTTVDHDRGALTLSYEHKGKSENFTGVLKHPVEIVDQDGQPIKAATHLQVGDRLTVYYIAQGVKYSTKEGDKRHDEVANENLIFKIKLLTPPNKKR